MKKLSMWIVAMIALVITIASAQYLITQYISGRLVIQNGATIQLRSSSALYAFGASSFNLGDSTYLSVGGVIADTSVFSAGSKRKAIYIAGATPNDVYYITNRVAYATPTSEALLDSTRLGYVAKTDSLIVLRSGTYGTADKFSWIRAKLQ